MKTETVRDAATIRDLLAPFHSVEHIHDPHGLLKSERLYRAGFLVTEQGRTFVSCGGTALIAFSRADQMGWPAYLVLNDYDGERWAAAQREAVRVSGFAPLSLGPRPSAKLELAQSA